MKSTAIIEKGKDGTYTIYSDILKSVIHASGNTVAEAKANYAEMLQEAQEIADELNGAPNELTGISFVYKYDISSLFNYFDWLNVSKVAKKIGLNPSLLRHYRRGGTYISERQAAKIEAGLHRLGAELTAILL
jgi:predicted RNase H-like HicB family nuclease